MRELAHFRRHAHRRNRDSPRADVQAFRIMQDAHRLHHVRVIGKRFAHAHEHDVADALLPGREPQVELDDLFDDLCGGEVAFDAAHAAGAKAATDRTADLGADARGAALRVGNHDGLGRGAAGPLQKELTRAVGAALIGGDRRGGKIKPVGEFGAINAA